MTDKKITLEIDGKDMEFTVSLTAYNACIDAMQTNNKIAPMYQFLKRCTQDREALEELYNKGLVPDIFGMVFDEYKPKIHITVKK